MEIIISSKQNATRKIIEDQNLSKTKEFTIDGPLGHKGLNQLSAPLFHFLPGGVREEVGEVVATTDNGLQFELKFKDEFAHLETASFEVQMRFHARRKK